MLRARLPFPFAGVLLLAVFCVAAIAEKAIAEEVDFGARHFSRDLGTNVTKLRGNAWARRGDRRIDADEIEIDYKTNHAVATGSVRIREGDVDISCRSANYDLSGQDAILEDATVSLGQLVITGAVIHRIGRDRYEIDQGSYSNCNIDLLDAKSVGSCSLDWKIYGRRINVDLGGYAHIHDALFSVKDLPVVYTPYLVLPVKSARASGFLWPRFTSQATLGSGVTVPYFLALGAWHDLTLEPTYYSKAGYHLGVEYRYNYDGNTKGVFDFFLLGKKYGTVDPYTQDPGSRKLFGFIGEGAIRATNRYQIGERSYSRQDIRLVSNPFWTNDRPQDLGPFTDLGYMRSQFAFTFPGDRQLLTVNSQLYQPLVVSKDRGVDKGPVGELPTAIYSRSTTSLLGRLFSYELDVRLSNFYRPDAFDPVPTSLLSQGVNGGASPTFVTGDYLRTGRRLILEPRLLMNVPLSPGIQFQPVAKTGVLLYNFSYPDSSLLAHPYLELEIPLSLYLQRSFTTGISGFEKISHVFQPRVSYATSRSPSQPPDHPFFYRDLPRPLDATGTTSLSNPRFDLFDQFTPFEYVRFELINRFRRRDSNGSVSRFLWLQLSQQINLQTFPSDSRYAHKFGPIELLSSIDIGAFSAQVQAMYPLELVRSFNGAPLAEPIRESEVSSSISYIASTTNRISLTSVFRSRADPAQRIQSAVLGLYKTLPTFFDVEGSAEYSMLHGELRGYTVGLHFHARPRSCWEIVLSTGRNAVKQNFAFVNFKLDFGAASSGVPF